MKNWKKISATQISREKNGTYMTVTKEKGYRGRVMDWRIDFERKNEDGIYTAETFKTQKEAIEFCEKLALEVETY